MNHAHVHLEREPMAFKRDERAPADPEPLAIQWPVPLHAAHYRCGPVFGVEIRVAGRVLFYFGSSELFDTLMPNLRVDLLMLCVAGWTSSHRPPERVMARLSPESDPARALRPWRYVAMSPSLPPGVANPGVR